MSTSIDKVFKMRYLLNLSLAISVCLLYVGCESGRKGLFEPETTEEAIREREQKKKMEIEAIVRERLADISECINEGKYDKAETLLMPMDKFEFCRQEVKQLRTAIALGRKENANKIAATLAEKSMYEEIDENQGLPGTYGKTIVIDSKLSPLELPQGKMEDLINRKVTMNLESATVGMLVDFLNENGLNVIADDALASEKTLTMKVTDVPLKEVLSYIARNMGIAFYIGENMVWITASDEKGGPKLETRILRLHHGFAPKVPAGGGGAPGSQMGGIGSVESIEDTELEDVLTTFLEGGPEGSSFQIFRSRNILVVRNTRENNRFVEQVLKDFDKPPMQVVIEARFLTVSQDDLRDVGVQITQNLESTFTNSRQRPRSKEYNFATMLGKLDQELGMGTLGLAGILGKRAFDMVIQAIDSKSSTVDLSIPKVTVMNNRTARIRKGEKIYYFDEYETATVNKGDNKGDVEVLVPSGSPTELPLGLTFDVSVNIGNNGKTIMLGLKPEIVELLKWENYTTTGSDDDDDDDDDDDNELTQIKLPRTYERAVATTVEVQSGETVVLGGMIDNKKIRTVKKIPLLGDLPLLGWLFRRTTTQVTPQNLLIFVTANVINSRGEYVKTIGDDDSGK